MLKTEKFDSAGSEAAADLQAQAVLYRMSCTLRIRYRCHGAEGAHRQSQIGNGVTEGKAGQYRHAGRRRDLPYDRLTGAPAAARRGERGGRGHPARHDHPEGEAGARERVGHAGGVGGAPEPAATWTARRATTCCWSTPRATSSTCRWSSWTA